MGTPNGAGQPETPQPPEPARDDESAQDDRAHRQSATNIRRDEANASPTRKQFLRKVETAPEHGGRVRSSKNLTGRSTRRSSRGPAQTLTFGRGSDEVIEQPTELNRALTFQYDGVGDSDLSSSSSDEDGDAEDGARNRRASPTSKTGARAHTEKSGKDQGAKDGGPGTNSLCKFSIGNDFFKTKGAVSKRDGRLKISIHETANKGYLAKALGGGIRHHLRDSRAHSHEKHPSKHDVRTPQANIQADLAKEPSSIPRLNIVIIVIGSRGDIQPFMKIGKILKEQYGHRVRIATHPAFKDFVEKDVGLEFFSVGGDPAELMAFMVKNPGLIPSMETVRTGEIGRRRAAMYEMFQGMWRACVNATEDETDKGGMKMDSWVCDAIIANPPSFAHVHIAERLGVPLSIFFTMPYSPTTAFPHPLANIKASNVDQSYTNFMSYPLVEMMTWQGLGDLVNRFREKTLALEPVSTLWAPGQLYRMKVPHTYMWSPGLVPKPQDWGPEISVTGYVFLDLASSFHPPEELTQFLDAGPPPVYIGFGSIVVDDPDSFTNMIFDAVQRAGVRALVSKGWGGLGDQGNVPDNVFMLDNTPHDWLFPRISATVIHGGAGTTAIALKCARPTFIVSFFGDQPFWGAMVARAGAGAKQSIPFKRLTAEALANGIEECLTDDARKHAAEIADSIAAEGDGAANAVCSFHRNLPLEGPGSMRCRVLPERANVWRIRDTDVSISALAAEVLVGRRRLRWQDLQLVRHNEWNDFVGPGEPITGVSSAIAGTFSEAAKGLGMVPVRMARMVKTRTLRWHKTQRRESKIQARQMRAKEKEAIANGAVISAVVGAGVGAKETRPKEKPTALNQDKSVITELNGSASPEDTVFEEFAYDAGHGMYKTGRALVHAPMMLSLAVAQGFHNAPRLYGDDTVRRPIRITGYKSGLRAGRNEFVHGLHDAFTGLYRHPAHGYHEDGAAGFLKGIGIGIGGFVLKDIAAVAGPIAYALKGLHEQRQRARQPTRYLRRARILQGQKEMTALGSEEARKVTETVRRKWEEWLEKEVTTARDSRERRARKHQHKHGKHEAKEEPRPQKSKTEPVRKSGEGIRVRSRPARKTDAAEVGRTASLERFDGTADRQLRKSRTDGVDLASQKGTGTVNGVT